MINALFGKKINFWKLNDEAVIADLGSLLVFKVSSLWINKEINTEDMTNSMNIFMSECNNLWTIPQMNPNKEDTDDIYFSKIDENLTVLNSNFNLAMKKVSDILYDIIDLSQDLKTLSDKIMDLDNKFNYIPITNWYTYGMGSSFEMEKSRFIETINRFKDMYQKCLKDSIDMYKHLSDEARMKNEQVQIEQAQKKIKKEAEELAEDINSNYEASLKQKEEAEEIKRDENKEKGNFVYQNLTSVPVYEDADICKYFTFNKDCEIPKAYQAELGSLLKRISVEMPDILKAEKISLQKRPVFRFISFIDPYNWCAMRVNRKGEFMIDKNMITFSVNGDCSNIKIDLCDFNKATNNGEDLQLLYKIFGKENCDKATVKETHLPVYIGIKAEDLPTPTDRETVEFVNK